MHPLLCPHGVKYWVFNPVLHLRELGLCRVIICPWSHQAAQQVSGKVLFNLHYSLSEGSSMHIEVLLCAKDWHLIIKSLSPMSLSASSPVQPLLHMGISGILNKKEKSSNGIFLL